MSLYINIITFKDRLKLRLLLDEAADLRRDILRAPRGSEAWLLLRQESQAVDASIRSTWARISMAGYVGAGPACGAELAFAAAVALAVLSMAYILAAA